jgi:hypothetical protein
LQNCCNPTPSLSSRCNDANPSWSSLYPYAPKVKSITSFSKLASHFAVAGGK